MANENPNEQIVVLTFPVKGYQSSTSFVDQPSLTTSLMKNCRLRDIVEQRARGGQRPGMEKAYSTQIGGEHPIIEMVQVTVTYITPEE